MPSAASRTRSSRRRRGIVERLLIGAAVIVAAVCLFVPLIFVVVRAFEAGWTAYVTNVLAPDTRHATWLTVVTAIVVVPINTIFGLGVAWLVTRFRFAGRRALLVLLDLPFSISPIVAGTMYLFLYGAQGLFGPYLNAHGIRLMFTVPAIVLASLFVTAPFVARELIPLMDAQGSDDEEAAISLGAGGLKTFWLVTLPNIRWALIYGVILCNARVMGEFGAVSVVSGNIRGKTNTLPLQIELLMNDYNTSGAFAAALTLVALALATLAAKYLLERKMRGQNGAEIGPARS
jgi:sulfate transport system permease protein